MQDLGGYGITVPVVRVPVHADPKGSQSTIAPGLALDVDARTRTARSGRSTCARTSSGMTAPPFTADDVVATMERLVKAGNSGLKGVLAGRWHGRQGREHGRVHARRRERQLPVPRLGVQRPDADHPEGLCRRDDARQGAGRDRGLEAQELRRRRPARSSRATPTGGAARRRSTATEFIFFDATGPMVTAYQGEQVDALVQFDVLSGAAAARRTRTSTVVARRATHHRQIWMRCDTGQFADKRGPPGPGLHVRSAGAHPAAVQGQGPARQRPRHLAGLSVLRLVRSRSGPRTSPRPSSSCPTPA